MTQHLGKLEFTPAAARPELLAAPVAGALTAPDWPFAADAVGVAEIDPSLADTAAFCAHYDISLAQSANCVVVSGRREGPTRYAACLVLATARAAVNNTARRELDVRKASFAPMDAAVTLTSMEYGGITPIGLPPAWPILIDAAVAATPEVIIGSGVRRSKLALPGSLLAALPGAQIIEGLAR